MKILEMKVVPLIELPIKIRAKECPATPAVRETPNVDFYEHRRALAKKKRQRQLS